MWFNSKTPPIETCKYRGGRGSVVARRGRPWCVDCCWGPWSMSRGSPQCKVIDWSKVTTWRGAFHITGKLTWPGGINYTSGRICSMASDKKKTQKNPKPLKGKKGLYWLGKLECVGTRTGWVIAGSRSQTVMSGLSFTSLALPGLQPWPHVGFIPGQVFPSWQAISAGIICPL